MNRVEDKKKGFQTMASSIEFAVNYTQWIVSYFKPYFGSSLLEVGTGQGNFKKGISGVEEFVSIDIDPAVVERASRKDPAGIYMTVDVTAGDFAERLGKKRFESILCLNVLEHLASEGLAIENMLEVLRPGGHLLILVPAFPALYMDLDRLAGHHRRYSRESFLNILPRRGCELVKLEYFNAMGGIGWWLNKSLSHDNIDSENVNRQVIFFDRYILPLSRMVNGFTRFFFGQSLISVVGRR